MRTYSPRWGAGAVAVGSALIPALHPLLRPLIGIPSHLLWFALTLPVAIVTYTWGIKAAVAAVVASVAWVGLGEHLFGGGYGVSADEATQLALMIATGFTSALLAGFSLAARAEREHARRVDAQLGQVQKMEAIGRLAGGVAHDFNNLLTVILSTAHVLRDETAPGTQAREDLDTIVGAATSASDLTRQLLAFSRRKEHTKRVLDINAVVSGMEGMLRRLVGEDVAVRFELAANTGHIEADAGQLEQVVMNLVANARDAMPEGGTITISTAARHIGARSSALRAGGGALAAGTYAVLEVTDTGVGMDAATRARIFEPFFTTKPPGKGTGLGLATVFGIIKAAGGDVLVASAPGKGTCIAVYFRQVPPPGTGSAASPVAGVHPIGAGRTVLVVEDQPLVREATRRMLQGMGFDVTAVEDGRAAVELLEQRPPFDLIVTDLVMPRMGGLDLAEFAERRAPNTRVLIVSGHADDGAGLRAALQRGRHFLHKPYDARTLGIAVENALADSAPAAPAGATTSQ